MDKLHDLFVRGQYDKCLQELEKISDSDLSIEDTFILENNRCVCRALISLVDGNFHNFSYEELLLTYDNFSLSSNHASQHLPLHLQLAIFFNCQWLALSTLTVSSENTDKWDGLLQRLASNCERISGEGLSPKTNHSTDLIEDLIEKLLAAKKKLGHTHKSTPIFIEVLALALLIVLLTHRTTHTLANISRCVKFIVEDSLELGAVAELSQKASRPEETSFFKFGLDCGPSTLFYVDSTKACSLVALIGYVVSTFLKNSGRGGHRHVDKTKWKSLWNYWEAFRQFQCEKLNEALSLLLEGLSSPCSIAIQAFSRCLLGQVYSAMGERYKALENYSDALRLDKSLSIAHFHQGYEYGKMGLHDSMLKSYQNLVMVMKKRPYKQSSATPVEMRILELLHNANHITRASSTYILAVAYGINEMFEDSAVVFENLLSPRNLSSIIDSGLRNENTVIHIPHAVTILHEAAAVNVLIGSLNRAEEICRQAISIYLTMEKHVHEQMHTDVHGAKDVQWIRNALDEEFQMDVEESERHIIYYEQYLSFFEEDVVGLLILADLQRIQESDEGRLTLNQALLLLSKYMARKRKDGEQNDQNGQEALVKALASKTCLQIARMQSKSRPFADVDKMFRRALSSNAGDKDVLYHYATFLLEANKDSDAAKLWHTFYETKPTILPEHAQSLALKYLLRTEISQRLITTLSLKLGSKIYLLTYFS